MGRSVIVLYRPKPGKAAVLLDVIRDHLPVLRKEGLATDRDPVVMRSSEGVIVEIFEWKSAEAIAAAHQHKRVSELWERFAEVCDYEIPLNVKEFQNLFSEFETIDIA